MYTLLVPTALASEKKRKKKRAEKRTLVIDGGTIKLYGYYRIRIADIENFTV